MVKIEISAGKHMSGKVDLVSATLTEMYEGIEKMKMPSMNFSEWIVQRM